MAREIIRIYEITARVGNAIIAAANRETRELAEEAADVFFERHRDAAPDVGVWAVVDSGSYLIYRLESVPDGVLVSRLRARLRHGRPVNQKQAAALTTIARAPGQEATEAQIRKAMGAYPTNSLKSCVQRGWMSETSPGSERYRLTDLGRSIVAELEAAARQGVDGARAIRRRTRRPRGLV